MESYFSKDERTMFVSIKGLCEAIPGTLRILAPLLARQWPKWHRLADVKDLEEAAIDALVSVGAVETPETVLEWRKVDIGYPSLPETASLIHDLNILKKQSRLDTLLRSLPPNILNSLSNVNNTGSLSKNAHIEKIKSAFEGKQRTIFGGVNDTSHLIQKISSAQEGRLIFLTKACRDVFLRFSFLLDIDCDETESWNSALPPTLLKSFANKGIGGTLTPRKMNQRLQCTIPPKMMIYESADHIEHTRILAFLQAKIEEKRICPRAVCANIRDYLRTIPILWERDKFPEWWWRRQLPRRCSNVIWKCIAELERLKFYEIAHDNLMFLVENNESLLGRKRRGKVAIRLLVEMGHLKIPLDSVSEKLLDMDLFPADRAEISRRLSGLSLAKFDWDCGAIDTRTIVVPGANTRDFNWVENAALEQYYLVPDLGGYTNGLHCEGRVMMEIFSVFFLEILSPESASAIEGAFQSPLQKWAMDVGYLRDNPQRWSQAEQILSDIESREYDQLSELFASKNSPVSEFQIASILSCLTGTVLAGIMGLMIEDPYYWGGGQPDLLAWNLDKKTIIFAEVKGPGDHLSPRQRWWLAKLKSFGASAEVCYVVDEPKETNRKKVKRDLP